MLAKYCNIFHFLLHFQTVYLSNFFIFFWQQILRFTVGIYCNDNINYVATCKLFLNMKRKKKKKKNNYNYKNSNRTELEIFSNIRGQTVAIIIIRTKRYPLHSIQWRMTYFISLFLLKGLNSDEGVMARSLR